MGGGYTSDIMALGRFHVFRWGCGFDSGSRPPAHITTHTSGTSEYNIQSNDKDSNHIPCIRFIMQAFVLKNTGSKHPHEGGVHTKHQMDHRGDREASKQAMTPGLWKKVCSPVHAIDMFCVCEDDTPVLHTEPMW